MPAVLTMLAWHCFMAAIAMPIALYANAIELTTIPRTTDEDRR